MLSSLNNYKKISDKLHTSAQPTAEEFKSIKQTGIEVVINLARADSPNAIINEANVVQENDMHYINIPVDFENPQTSDLEIFFSTMEQYANATILVHCALNWRVACFVFLYRILKQNCEHQVANQDMLAIWTPDETWASFIDLCLSKKDKL
jgi:protein tyrosine phosphatase (PTP) superfamily phosphohydrolase (DUF442 family)